MKKRILTIIAIVVLVALGIFFLRSIPEKEGGVSPEAEQQGEETPMEEEVPEGAEAVEEVEEVEEVEKVGIPVALGASPISKEGVVVTGAGEPVDSEANPGTSDAPKLSKSLKEEEVPAASIKVTASAAGFSPNEFTVSPGQAVTLCVTAEGTMHGIAFASPKLRAVDVAAYTGQTRCMSFNTPEERGDYAFFCGIPGHKERGETGVMHVK